MNTDKILTCPACGNTLSKLKVENIMLDVCQDSCGGIWFDNFELRNFDEKFETAGEVLLNIRKNSEIPVDFKKKRKCPVCPDSTLMRHFHSPSKKIVVDDCPTCRGIWLDTGELALMRNEFNTDEERKRQTQKFIEDYSSKLHYAQNELLKANVSDEEELKLLEDNNLSEQEKIMLINNKEELEMHKLGQLADTFAKIFPYLYISWYIPGKQKGMTY